MRHRHQVTRLKLLLRRLLLLLSQVRWKCLLVRLFPRFFPVVQEVSQVVIAILVTVLGLA